MQVIYPFPSIHNHYIYTLASYDRSLDSYKRETEVQKQYATKQEYEVFLDQAAIVSIFSFPLYFIDSIENSQSPLTQVMKVDKKLPMVAKTLNVKKQVISTK